MATAHITQFSSVASATEIRSRTVPIWLFRHRQVFTVRLAHHCPSTAAASTGRLGETKNKFESFYKPVLSRAFMAVIIGFYVIWIATVISVCCVRVGLLRRGEGAHEWRWWGGSTYNTFNTYRLALLPSWDNLQSYASWMAFQIDKKK